MADVGLNVTKKFQSTHPRRVRRLSKAFSSIDADFNPRTRVGCDGTGNSIAFKASNDFNPRTRVGCDTSLINYL